MEALLTAFVLPSFKAGEFEKLDTLDDHRLRHEAEDAALKQPSESFPSWIVSFVRRVIQLLENLPEEASSGTDSATEG
jgi:proteasome activator subunit 4